MKHQESKYTGLRWHIGILGVVCTVWAWMLSWAMVVMSINIRVWVAEWLTYIAVGCFIIVVLLPSENKDEKRKERSKSEKVGDG